MALPTQGSLDRLLALEHGNALPTEEDSVEAGMRNPSLLDYEMYTRNGLPCFVLCNIACPEWLMSGLDSLCHDVFGQVRMLCPSTRDTDLPEESQLRYLLSNESWQVIEPYYNELWAKMPRLEGIGASDTLNKGACCLAIGMSHGRKVTQKRIARLGLVRCAVEFVLAHQDVHGPFRMTGRLTAGTRRRSGRVSRNPSRWR